MSLAQFQLSSTIVLIQALLYQCRTAFNGLKNSLNGVSSGQMKPLPFIVAFHPRPLYQPPYSYVAARHRRSTPLILEKRQLITPTGVMLPSISSAFEPCVMAHPIQPSADGGFQRRPNIFPTGSLNTSGMSGNMSLLDRKTYLEPVICTSVSGKHHFWHDEFYHLCMDTSRPIRLKVRLLRSLAITDIRTPIVHHGRMPIPLTRQLRQLLDIS